MIHTYFRKFMPKFYISENKKAILQKKDGLPDSYKITLIKTLLSYPLIPRCRHFDYYFENCPALFG